MSTGVEKKYDIMTSGTSCESQDAITCSYDDHLKATKDKLADCDMDCCIVIRMYSTSVITPDSEACSIAALQG